MRARILTLVLVVGLAFSSLALGGQLVRLRLPGNRQGYEPAQPIAYSHRLHAGELQIPCQYCHTGAGRSRYAGIPPASTCMNCHRFVTAPRAAVAAEDEAAQKEGRSPRPVVSAELRKLYDALGLDDQLQSDPHRTPQPIRWVRVHQLPAFAHFNHSAHVTAGVDCTRCHGPVQGMERVRQVESLSMGWCVECHREANRIGVNGKPVHASTDCDVCHY